MSAVTEPQATTTSGSLAERTLQRRNRRFGAFSILLAVVMAAVFSSSARGQLFNLPNLSVSVTPNSPTRFPTLAIPLLSEIPIIGPVLFRQSILVFGMFAAVIALQYGLFRTRWGL